MRARQNTPHASRVSWCYLQYGKRWRKKELKGRERYTNTYTYTHTHTHNCTHLKELASASCCCTIATSCPTNTTPQVLPYFLKLHRFVLPVTPSVCHSKAEAAGGKHVHATHPFATFPPPFPPLLFYLIFPFKHIVADPVPRSHCRIRHRQPPLSIYPANCRLPTETLDSRIGRRVLTRPGLGPCVAIMQLGGFVLLHPRLSE
jgi:hypothetical protein